MVMGQNRAKYSISFVESPCSPGLVMKGQNHCLIPSCKFIYLCVALENKILKLQ